MSTNAKFPDPNANNPLCQSAPLVVNYSTGGNDDEYVEFQTVWIGIVLGLASASYAVFITQRRKYPSTRVRSPLAPTLFFVALVNFIGLDSGGKIVGFHTVPCAVAAAFSMSVVMFYGFALLVQYAMYLLLNRFALSVARYGRTTDADADAAAASADVTTSSTTILARATWSVRAAIRATLVLIEPIPKREADLEMSPAERVRLLTTLKFVLTWQGQAVMTLVNLAPFALIVVIVASAGAPEYYRGCIWCVIGPPVQGVVLGEGLTYVLIGWVLGRRTRGLKDPWLLLREARTTVAISFICVLGFVLVVLFPKVPKFDMSFFIGIGLLLTLMQATVAPVVRAYRLALVERRNSSSKTTSGAAGRVLTSKRRGSKNNINNAAVADGGVGTSAGANSTWNTSVSTPLVPEESGCSRLARVLADDVLVDKFEAFLTSEFSSELLAFCEDAAEFAADFHTASPATRAARARKIVKNFLTPGAWAEINVSDAVSGAIHAKIKAGEFSQDMFLPAHVEVCRLMEQGPLERFVRSKEFLQVEAQRAVAQVVSAV